MTNKELIEKLLKLPFDVEVWHEDINFGSPLERLDSGDIVYKVKICQYIFKEIFNHA